jgi:tetratricopeptide (TPR) repeat protein
MAENNLPAKVLIVDDDPAIAKGLDYELARLGVKVVAAKDLDTAHYQFNQQLFEVVLCELEFEPLPGLALVQKWRGHESRERAMAGMILIAGRQRRATDDALLKELGGIEVLSKPFTAVQVLPYLARALATRTRTIKFEEIKGTVTKLAEKYGKVDKAVQLVEKQLGDLGPKGTELIVDLYEKAKQPSEALQRVEKLLQQNPTSISYLNTRGRLLLALGRHAEALTNMEQADKVAPQNIERINNMATLYLHLHKPEQSVSKMRELVNLNPEHPDIKFDLFARLEDFGFAQVSQEFCREITGPMDVVRHYNNKGVALSKGGRAQEAVKEYLRSLQYFPKYKENYRILYNIALAMLAEKKRDNFVQALDYIEKALALEPTFEKGLKLRDMIKGALEKPKAS